MRESARLDLARRQLTKQTQQPRGAGIEQATVGHGAAASLPSEGVRDGARQELARSQLAKQSQAQDPDGGAGVAERPGPRGPPRRSR